MLHLMKLAVGVRDPAHLHDLQALRVVEDPAADASDPADAASRAEVAAGGSLYWVIAGSMLVRQRVLDIVPDAKVDGSACAAILLDPALVAVAGRPVGRYRAGGTWRPKRLRRTWRQVASMTGCRPNLAQILRELCLL